MRNEFSRHIRIDHIDGKDKRERIEADALECAALAKRFGIISVDSLVADVVVAREGDRMTYHVTGNLRADVIQACVVGGEKVSSKITEDFEAWFIDQTYVANFKKVKDRKEREESSDEIEMTEEKDDPEQISDGKIDIGEVVAQYLGLSLDPYPRANSLGHGDYIEVKEGKRPNPFAVLADMDAKREKKD